MVLSLVVQFGTTVQPGDGVTTEQTTWLPFDMPISAYYDDSDIIAAPHLMVNPSYKRSLENKNLETDATAYERRNFLPPGGLEGGVTDHRVYGGLVRNWAQGRNPMPSTTDRPWQYEDKVQWMKDMKATGMRHFWANYQGTDNVAEMISYARAAIEAGMPGAIIPMVDGSSSSNTTISSLVDVKLRPLWESQYKAGFAKWPDGRWLLAAYGPELVRTSGTANTQAVQDHWIGSFQALAAAGHSVAFWPCFTRSWTTVSENTAPLFTTAPFAPYVVGLGRWGASDPDTARSPSVSERGAVATARTTYGKPYLSPVRVEDSRPKGASFREPRGWDLLKTSWEVALDTYDDGSGPGDGSDKAGGFQIPTWNDWAENSGIAPSILHSKAVLDICTYYVAQARLGYTPPIIRDTLYLAHRVQFGPEGGTTTYTAPAPYAGANMTRQANTPEQSIVDVLVFAAGPGRTVEITTSAGTTTQAVPAGVSRVTAPLALGAAGSISCQMKSSNSAVIPGTLIISPYAVESTRLVQDLVYRRMSSRR